MDLKEVESNLEAILFANGDPLSIDKLCEILELDKVTMEKILEQYADKLEERKGAIILLRLEDKYQLCTKMEYAPIIERTMNIHKNTPLSQAAMEVLSIISYYQARNEFVTKKFVEKIRKVDSSAIINSLVSKNLVEEAGRLDILGRPRAYKTTPNFLRCFGLASISELPFPDIEAEAEAEIETEAEKLSDINQN